MVDLTKIPVTERYRVFAKHKENMLAFFQTNRSYFNSLHYLGSDIEVIVEAQDIATYIEAAKTVLFSQSKENGLARVYTERYAPYLEKVFPAFISAFEEVMSFEEMKTLTSGNLLSLPSVFLRYIGDYLQYAPYADQINSVLMRYLTEDPLGKLVFGRVKNEMLKIAKKNQLKNFFYQNTLRGLVLEIACGEVAMNLRTKAPLVSSQESDESLKHVCEKKLRELGYSISPANRSGVRGDILAKKKGVTYIIRCKNSPHRVGIHTVAGVISARRYYKADIAAVLTLGIGEYTLEAGNLATEHNVILLVGNQLDSLEAALTQKVSGGSQSKEKKKFTKTVLERIQDANLDCREAKGTNTIDTTDIEGVIATPQERDSDKTIKTSFGTFEIVTNQLDWYVRLGSVSWSRIDVSGLATACAKAWKRLQIGWPDEINIPIAPQSYGLSVSFGQNEHVSFFGRKLFNDEASYNEVMSELKLLVESAEALQSAFKLVKN